MLDELAKDPEFKIQVTEDEIADRSKGNALSKIIFMLQSSWFILQYLACRAQGLSSTQLELTTLALASLNGITFLLWWDKPVGAQMPVRVYLNRKLTEAERKVEGVSDFFTGDQIYVDQQLQRHRSRRSLLVPSEAFVTAILHSEFKRYFVVLIPFLPFLPLFVLVAFFFAFLLTLADLALGGSTSFLADATHVPTFYAPRHRYSEWFHIVLLTSLGSIFGGIHCAGWSFPFPSYAE